MKKGQIDCDRLCQARTMFVPLSFFDDEVFTWILNNPNLCETLLKGYKEVNKVC